METSRRTECLVEVLQISMNAHCYIAMRGHLAMHGHAFARRVMVRVTRGHSPMHRRAVCGCGAMNSCVDRSVRGGARLVRTAAYMMRLVSPSARRKRRKAQAENT